MEFYFTFYNRGCRAEKSVRVGEQGNSGRIEGPVDSCSIVGADLPLTAVSPAKCMRVTVVPAQR